MSADYDALSRTISSPPCGEPALTPFHHNTQTESRGDWFVNLGPPPGTAPSEAGFGDREGSANGDGTGGLGAMLRALKHGSGQGERCVLDTDEGDVDETLNAGDSFEGEATAAAGATDVT